MEYLCTTNITKDDKLDNVIIVETLKELNKVVIENRSHNLIRMRSDFIDEFLSHRDLQDFIKTVQKINPNAIIQTEDYNVDDDIDKDILNTIKRNLTEDELALLLHFHSNKVLEAISTLIEKYDSDKKELLDGAAIISGLREAIDDKNSEIKKLKDMLNSEQMNKLDVQNKLNVLTDRIKYTHNISIDENMLFKSGSNKYIKIIYIKEVTRVQYVDTLIDTFQDICKILYSLPTRILCIEGYHASDKPRLYPNLVPHYKLTDKDVLSSDILMLGFQPNIVKDVLKNPSNIAILIVLDRGGYVAPHIYGDNIEYLYTASDSRDVPSDVPRSRIISYNKEEGTLFIPHIKDFETLDSNARVREYSSKPIMKQLVSLVDK